MSNTHDNIYDHSNIDISMTTLFFAKKLHLEILFETTAWHFLQCISKQWESNFTTACLRFSFSWYFHQCTTVHLIWRIPQRQMAENAGIWWHDGMAGRSYEKVLLNEIDFSFLKYTFLPPQEEPCFNKLIISRTKALIPKLFVIKKIGKHFCSITSWNIYIVR